MSFQDLYQSILGSNEDRSAPCVFTHHHGQPEKYHNARTHTRTDIDISQDTTDLKQANVTWVECPTRPGYKYRASMYRENEPASGGRDPRWSGPHAMAGSFSKIINGEEIVLAPQWFIDDLRSVWEAMETVANRYPTGCPILVTACATRSLELQSLQTGMPGMPVICITTSRASIVKEKVIDSDVHFIELDVLTPNHIFVPRSLAILRLLPWFFGSDDREWLISNGQTQVVQEPLEVLKTSIEHGGSPVYINNWGGNPICLFLAACRGGHLRKTLRHATFTGFTYLAHWVYGADEAILCTTPGHTICRPTDWACEAAWCVRGTNYTLRQSHSAFSGNKLVTTTITMKVETEQVVPFQSVRTWLARPTPDMPAATPAKEVATRAWRGNGSVDYEWSDIEPIPAPKFLLPGLDATGKAFIVGDKQWRYNETCRGFRSTDNKTGMYLCEHNDTADWLITLPRDPATMPAPLVSAIADVERQTLAAFNKIKGPVFVTCGDKGYEAHEHTWALLERIKHFGCKGAVVYVQPGFKPRWQTSWSDRSTSKPIDLSNQGVHLIEVPLVNRSKRSLMYWRLIPYFISFTSQDPKTNAGRFVIGNMRAGWGHPNDGVRQAMLDSPRNVLSWNEFHYGRVMNSAHYGSAGGIPIMKEEFPWLIKEFGHCYGPDEMYMYKHTPTCLYHKSFSLYGNLTSQLDCQTPADVFHIKPDGSVEEHGVVTSLTRQTHILDNKQPGRTTTSEFSSLSHVVFSPSWRRRTLHIADLSPWTLNGLIALHKAGLRTVFSPDSIMFLTAGTTGDVVPFKFMALQTHKLLSSNNVERQVVVGNLVTKAVGLRLLDIGTGAGYLMEGLPLIEEAYRTAQLAALFFSVIVPAQLDTGVDGQIRVSLTPSRWITKGFNNPKDPLFSFVVDLDSFSTIFGYRVSSTIGVNRIPRSADGRRLVPKLGRRAQMISTGRRPTKTYTIMGSGVTESQARGAMIHPPYQLTDLDPEGHFYASGHGTIDTLFMAGFHVSSLRPTLDTNYTDPARPYYFMPVQAPAFMAAAPALGVFGAFSLALPDLVRTTKLFRSPMIWFTLITTAMAASIPYLFIGYQVTSLIINNGFPSLQILIPNVFDDARLRLMATSLVAFLLVTAQKIGWSTSALLTFLACKQAFSEPTTIILTLLGPGGWNGFVWRVLYTDLTRRAVQEVLRALYDILLTVASTVDTGMWMIVSPFEFGYVTLWHLQVYDERSHQLYEISPQHWKDDPRGAIAMVRSQEQDPAWVFQNPSTWKIPMPRGRTLAPLTQANYSIGHFCFTPLLRAGDYTWFLIPVLVAGIVLNGWVGVLLTLIGLSLAKTAIIYRHRFYD